MRTLYTKVAGVTYENRQEHLARLHGNEAVRLLPEPTNKYDANAIAVQIAMPPEAGGEVLHCGYVPKEIAAQIAPLMEGEAFMCEIEDITGGFELSDGTTAALGLRLKIELPDNEDEIQRGLDDVLNDARW